MSIKLSAAVGENRRIGRDGFFIRGYEGSEYLLAVYARVKGHRFAGALTIFALARIFAFDAHPQGNSSLTRKVSALWTCKSLAVVALRLLRGSPGRRFEKSEKLSAGVGNFAGKFFVSIGCFVPHSRIALFANRSQTRFSAAQNARYTYAKPDRGDKFPQKKVSDVLLTRIFVAPDLAKASSDTPPRPSSRVCRDA
jgi:hypothetical protein